MHGQYPSRIKEADVDYKRTNDWLKRTDLKADTEGLLIAAQDKSSANRMYDHSLSKTEQIHSVDYVTSLTKASNIF